MNVTINGEPREFEPGANVAAAVDAVSGEPGARGLAVALDGEVVPRGQWLQTPLREGARVEIVVAVQGG